MPRPSRHFRLHATRWTLAAIAGVLLLGCRDVQQPPQAAGPADIGGTMVVATPAEPQVLLPTLQVTSIERELKTIRRDLNDLMDRFENVSGYRKEIDHALARIAAIEKHLGLDKKTAA